ncbi:MAG: Maf family protein [Coriobacteriia bacterium]|nr:Maf family protein [Coriobacteriia bacterium]
MQKLPLNVVLASGSPRRKQLLEDAGIKFVVYRPTQEVDESLEPDDMKDPAGAVKKLAERKAGAVVQDILSQNPKGAGLIIGADTTVVLDGEMMGKPYSADHAREMLRKLSGRTHEVITGVSLWLVMLGDPTEDQPEGTVSMGFRSFHETSQVTFKELTDDDIRLYVATGETIDKAGAYAIQGKGAALVDHHEGDYNNIVGLPVDRLVEAFPDIKNGYIEVEVPEAEGE